MARREQPEHDAGSDSSFLDVITNCVGILIILVIVVGIRAKKFPLGLKAPSADLTALRAEAAAVEQDVHQIALRMKTVQGEIYARAAEREQVSTLATSLERQLADRRAALDGAARERYDAQRDLALAKNELARVESERQQTQTSAAPKIVEVESYPTPLGKTVDGKEAHFQLVEGRIVYVPFEALLDRLRGAMREHMNEFEGHSDVSDTLGPVGGFRLRYFMDRVETRQGAYVQVSHIEFLPTATGLGEPVDTALAARSQFRDKLEMLSPRQYTITIWTYPDSFAEYRRIKKELFQLGYAVAARPLPDGMPIAGSPQGSKSAAQ